MTYENDKKRSTTIWVLDKAESSIKVATVSRKDRWKRIFEDLQLEETFTVEVARW